MYNKPTKTIKILNDQNKLDEELDNPEEEFISRVMKKTTKTIIYKGNNNLAHQLSSFAGIGLSPYIRSSTKNIRHKTINFDGIKEYYEDELTGEDEEFLKERLKASLKCLSVNFIKGYDITDKIINKMVYHKMKSGKILYNQDEEGSYFYIIKSGKFGFFVENDLKMVYEKHSFLGDFSLTNNNNKIITFSSSWCVRCIEDSELYIISSSDVRNIQQKCIQSILNQYLISIQTNPYLKYLNKLDQKLLSEQIEIINPNKGEVIQEFGVRVEGLYMINKGKVKMSNILGEKTNYINSTESFNDEYCLMDYNSKFEFVVETDNARLFYLSKKNLKNILGEEFQKEIIFQMFVYVCRYNSTLNNLINEYVIENDNTNESEKDYNIENNYSNNASQNGSNKSRNSINMLSNNAKLYNKRSSFYLNNVLNCSSKENNKISNKSILSANVKITGSPCYIKDDLISSANKHSQIRISKNNNNNSLINIANNTNLTSNIVNNNIQELESYIGENLNISNFNQLKNDYMFSNYFININIEKFKSVFDKFTFKIYMEGASIDISSINKCIIILKGSIVNKLSKKIIGERMDIVGDYFLEDIGDNEHFTPDGLICLESNYITLLAKNIKDKNLKYLKKFHKYCTWMKFLSNKSINELSHYIKVKKYNNGEVVKSYDKYMSSIIFIVSGSILKYKLINNNSNNKDSLHSKSNKDLNFKMSNSNNNSNYQKSLVYSYGPNSIIGEKEVFLNYKENNIILESKIHNIRTNKSDYNLDCNNKEIISSSNSRIIDDVNNTYYSFSNVIILTISKTKLFNVLSSLILKFIQSNLFTVYKSLPILESNKTDNNKIQLNLENSKLLAYLGKGSYGKVNLMNIDNNIFAVKAISKKMLLKKKILIEYLMSEKNCMDNLLSPFIVTLKNTCADKDYCYFLLEYAQGDNFRTISESNSLKYKKEACMFYFANIMIILEHLKQCNIIHRDLKTANMILTNNGFLKLLDFGLSKLSKDYAYTVIGSPFYMAPEVILGKGYDRSCDFWSSGIILYELFYGCFPFGKNCFTTLEVYNQILNNELIFPIVDLECGVFEINSIIRKLLNKSLRERISSLKECKDILPRFNWDGVLDMTIEPPLKFVGVNKKLEFYNSSDGYEYYKINKNKDAFNLLKLKGIEFNLEYMKKDNKTSSDNELFDIITEEDQNLFKDF